MTKIITGNNLKKKTKPSKTDGDHEKTWHDQQKYMTKTNTKTYIFLTKQEKVCLRDLPCVKHLTL